MAKRYWNGVKWTKVCNDPYYTTCTYVLHTHREDFDVSNAQELLTYESQLSEWKEYERSRVS